MTNLRKLICECPPKDWWYYRSKSAPDNPFFDTDSTCNTHRRFIDKYFEAGEKEGLFKNKIFKKDKIPTKRYVHTNSIFYLGIIIARKTKLWGFINAIINNDTNDFIYLWYLTCLFHDLGYEYELDKENMIQLNGMENLKKHFMITHELDLQITKVKAIPTTIMKTIQDYYRYKTDVRKSLDHGIVAAYYFYDWMVKNNEKKIKYSSKNTSLIWGEGLNLYYAEAAMAIAVHNIWFCKDDCKYKPKYENYGLNDLIGHPPINYKESPLLFLLGLVDTIDPVKTYEGDTDKRLSILDDLSIEVHSDGIILSMCQSSSCDFSNIRSKVGNLNGWFDVSIDDNGEKQIINILFSETKINNKSIHTAP